MVGPRLTTDSASDLSASRLMRQRSDVTPSSRPRWRSCPTKPGVYLMKDDRGRVLYVGKAQSLRNRVRQYWQKQPRRRRRRCGSSAHRPRRRRRVHDRPTRVSEALLLEANADQAPPAALQRPAQGRQELPVHQGHPGRRLPAHRADPQAAERRQPLLRPVCVGASSVDEAMNLIRRLFPFRTCTIEIKEGKRALPRPCLLYHIKRCQGPCIEAIVEGRLPRRHRPGDALPRGPPGAGRRGAARGDDRRLRRDRVRAGRRTCATSCAPSSGRWKSRRWPPSRGPRWTSWATRGQGNGAAVQLFAIREGTTIARDVFLLENVGDSPDEEALSAFIKQYYAARRLDSATRPAAAAAVRTLPSSSRFSSHAAAARSSSPCRSAARGAS